MPIAERIPPTHSIPQETLAEGLDFALALDVIQAWDWEWLPGRARYFHVTFSDGTRAAWTPGMALCFCLGVRLTALREEEELDA